MKCIVIRKTKNMVVDLQGDPETYTEKLELKITSYIMSQFHAIVAILAFLHMTFASCEKEGATPFDDPECLDDTSAGMELCFLVSLSYFFMDILTLNYIFGMGRLTRETLAHHLIGVFGIVSALVLGRVVGTLAMCLMLTELSTIFLNVRAIMKYVGLDVSKPKLYLYNGLVLIISLFLCRVVFMGLVIGLYIVPVLREYDFVALEKELGWWKVKWAQSLTILFCLLYLLNIYWFIKIVHGACQHVLSNKANKIRDGSKNHSIMNRELKRMGHDVKIEIDEEENDFRVRQSLSKQPLNEKELTAHEGSQEDKRSVRLQS